MTGVSMPPMRSPPATSGYCEARASSSARASASGIGGVASDHVRMWPRTVERVRPENAVARSPISRGVPCDCAWRAQGTGAPFNVKNAISRSEREVYLRPAAARLPPADLPRDRIDQLARITLANVVEIEHICIAAPGGRDR